MNVYIFFFSGKKINPLRSCDVWNRIGWGDQKEEGWDFFKSYVLDTHPIHSQAQFWTWQKWTIEEWRKVLNRENEVWYLQDKNEMFLVKKLLLWIVEIILNYFNYVIDQHVSKQQFFLRCHMKVLWMKELTNLDF